LLAWLSDAITGMIGDLVRGVSGVVAIMSAILLPFS
jgi:hypothetical protein